jgi:hypothetical protein
LFLTLGGFVASWPTLGTLVNIFKNVVDFGLGCGSLAAQ